MERTFKGLSLSLFFCWRYLSYKCSKEFLIHAVVIDAAVSMRFCFNTKPELDLVMGFLTCFESS